MLKALLILAVLLPAASHAQAPQIRSQQWIGAGLGVTIRAQVPSPTVSTETEVRLRACILQWAVGPPDPGLRTTEVACAPASPIVVSPPIPEGKYLCFRTRRLPIPPTEENPNPPPQPNPCRNPGAWCASCEEVQDGTLERTLTIASACDAGVPDAAGQYPSCTVSAWSGTLYDWRPCTGAGKPPC